jgi:hypothetical protein
MRCTRCKRPYLLLPVHLRFLLSNRLYAHLSLPKELSSSKALLAVFKPDLTIFITYRAGGVRRLGVTPHTTPHFLPPEDPSPVLLRPNSIPE